MVNCILTLVPAFQHCAFPPRPPPTLRRHIGVWEDDTVTSLHPTQFYTCFTHFSKPQQWTRVGLAIEPLLACCSDNLKSAGGLDPGWRYSRTTGTIFLHRRQIPYRVSTRVSI